MLNFNQIRQLSYSDATHAYRSGSIDAADMTLYLAMYRSDNLPPSCQHENTTCLESWADVHTFECCQCGYVWSE